ncbi:MAG: NAD-dependent epimerase/dehydratase family protein [Candidatus Glassbacteria bacterium]
MEKSPRLRNTGKVLVTGATGFTGGHLARRLLAEGAGVRLLVRPGRDVRFLEERGAEIVLGDLTDAVSVETAVEEVDTVYHIAALYRQEGVSRKAFEKVNIDGTRNLLEASRKAGVRRFVHCSTVGVQGEIKNPPATEEHPYNPGDHYQWTKMEGEKIALKYFTEGLGGVVFRPVGIYGPGDRRFLKLFRFIKKGKFKMFGSGNVLYHMTYIDDLVDGIILVGTVPKIEGEIFTIGGESHTTLNDLVNLIAEVLNVKVSRIKYPVWPLWIAGALCEIVCKPFGLEPPIYRRRVEFFIKDRAFDISKAKTMLGYKPKVDLRVGIQRTAEWYERQGLLD